MPNSFDWDAPEIASTEDEERQYALDVVKTALRFCIFSVFLYTLIIWGFSNLLMKSNILPSSVPWHYAGILSMGIIVLRVWDKTFFK